MSFTMYCADGSSPWRRKLSARQSTGRAAGCKASAGSNLPTCGPRPSTTGGQAACRGPNPGSVCARPRRRHEPDCRQRPGNRCGAAVPRAAAFPDRCACRPATVDEHVRMPPPQFVPVGQIILHMSAFGDALAVRCVVFPSESQRVHIEILAVKIDPLFANQAIHMIGEPPARIRISQVQRFAAEQALGVGLRQP